MSRWAHYLLGLALALAAGVGPCSELLMASQPACHDCCGKQRGVPAKSPTCQIHCGTAEQPVVVEFTPNAVVLGPAPLAGHLAPNLRPADYDPSSPIGVRPPGRLYLQHSSLLI